MRLINTTIEKYFIVGQLPLGSLEDSSLASIHIVENAES